jgi:hypothetical protein
VTSASGAPEHTTGAGAFHETGSTFSRTGLRAGPYFDCLGQSHFARQAVPRFVAPPFEPRRYGPALGLTPISTGAG